MRKHGVSVFGQARVSAKGGGGYSTSLQQCPHCSNVWIPAPCGLSSLSARHEDYVHSSCVCVCVCVCDLYFLRGRSLCSHEMAGVFGSVCCCLFAPVIHPFCGIRTSVCVRLGNLGAGPSVCPQKELAADCFRIRRLYQPLWNRGWWGGRGWRFGPPPLGGGRRWGLVWRPQRGLTCL